jgi:ABC-type Fe3+/spermidine/putrescine transport system ATPase subunit
MSDRLAVMDHGRVQQCGRPREVYREPLTEFIADFLGLANLFDVACIGAAGAGRARVRLGGMELTATCAGAAEPGPGRVVIRPERIRLAAEAAGENVVPATVDHLVYVGPVTQVFARLSDGPTVQALVVNDSDSDDLRPGDEVTLTLPFEALRLLERTDQA